jgi:hypothetical protein
MGQAGCSAERRPAVRWEYTFAGRKDSVRKEILIEFQFPRFSHQESHRLPKQLLRDAVIYDSVTRR